MVSDFLKNRMAIHTHILHSLEEERSVLNIRIVETEKFIKILTKGTDRFNNDFSPYQNDNADQKKIKELRELLRTSKDNLVECQHKIDQESSLIEQYKSVIIEAEMLEKK